MCAEGAVPEASPQKEQEALKRSNLGKKEKSWEVGLGRPFKAEGAAGAEGDGWREQGGSELMGSGVLEEGEESRGDGAGT